MNHKISNKIFIGGMVAAVLVCLVGLEIKQDWSIIAAMALIALSFIQASIFLKCPECGGSLNCRPRPDHCPHCGKSIEW